MYMQMINSIIKYIFMNLFTYYTFFNITNNKEQNFCKKLAIAFVSILTSIICVLIKYYINQLLAITISCIIQILNLKIILKDNRQLTSVSVLVANAITYIIFAISMAIEFVFQKIFKINDISNVLINLVIVIVLEGIILIGFFRIKRFRKGFSFLQDQSDNEYIDFILMNIVAVILFVYCLFGNSNVEIARHILIPFITLGIIMIFTIYKTITLYYKQKLLEQNLKSYEQEIAEKDKQIQNMSDEKFKISKVNHEFYNRQRALEMAVKEFISNSNMETSKEIIIMDKIESLSKEYSGKIEEIKKVEKLPETEIEEIDEMFRYMQSECIKNNIEFSLKINGNIFHMINNLIDKDRLVTLIGDHIRDAIIAVNHSDNNYRSIVATLGMNDNCYEFRVYDTGIEFEIDTLLKLGIEPATTHAEEGGSGIGFITTFETMKNSKSSLIIEEKNKENDNDYTKAVIIKFDGKNEYRILSYRASEIKNKCKDNRIKIDNK